MAADLDDLCERTERLEDAITGDGGLRDRLTAATTRLEAHLDVDEAFQREAREEWGRAREERVRVAGVLAEVKAATEKPRGPSAAVIAAYSTAATTVLGGIAAVVAALMGADPPQLPTPDAVAAEPPGLVQPAPTPTTPGDPAVTP